MAGTTRLELATSCVTEIIKRYLSDLSNLYILKINKFTGIRTNLPYYIKREIHGKWNPFWNAFSFNPMLPLNNVTPVLHYTAECLLKEENMYKKNLNVRLDEELEILLNDLKNHADINISSLVRRILKTSLINSREIIDNIGGTQVHEE